MSAEPDRRGCAICGSDISEKRRDAVVCGAPCRAEKSRRDRGIGPSPPEAHIGARGKARARSKPRKATAYVLIRVEDLEPVRDRDGDVLRLEARSARAAEREGEPIEGTGARLIAVAASRLSA